MDEWPGQRPRADAEDQRSEGLEPDPAPAVEGGDPDRWVPGPLRSLRGGPGAARGADAPDPGPGGGAAAARVGTAAVETAADAVSERPREPAAGPDDGRSAHLERRLAELEQRQAEHAVEVDERLGAVESILDHFDARLTGLASRVAAEGAADRAAGSAVGASTPSPGGDGESPSPSPPAGPLDLNEATFEQLRELGCSVTQAARIVAVRSKVGGFESVDDLDRVPGFPAAQRAELKQRLRDAG